MEKIVIKTFGSILNVLYGSFNHAYFSHGQNGHDGIYIQSSTLDLSSKTVAIMYSIFLNTSTKIPLSNINTCPDLLVLPVRCISQVHLLKIFRVLCLLSVSSLQTDSSVFTFGISVDSYLTFDTLISICYTTSI